MSSWCSDTCSTFALSPLHHRRTAGQAGVRRRACRHRARCLLRRHAPRKWEPACTGTGEEPPWRRPSRCSCSVQVRDGCSGCGRNRVPPHRCRRAWKSALPGQGRARARPTARLRRAKRRAQFYRRRPCRRRSPRTRRRLGLWRPPRSQRVCRRRSRRARRRFRLKRPTLLRRPLPCLRRRRRWLLRACKRCSPSMRFRPCPSPPRLPRGLRSRSRRRHPRRLWACSRNSPLVRHRRRLHQRCRHRRLPWKRLLRLRR